MIAVPIVPYRPSLATHNGVTRTCVFAMPSVYPPPIRRARILYGVAAWRFANARNRYLPVSSLLCEIQPKEHPSSPLVSTPRVVEGEGSTWPTSDKRSNIRLLGPRTHQDARDVSDRRERASAAWGHHSLAVALVGQPIWAAAAMGSVFLRCGRPCSSRWISSSLSNSFSQRLWATIPTAGERAWRCARCRQVLDWWIRHRMVLMKGVRPADPAQRYTRCGGKLAEVGVLPAVAEGSRARIRRCDAMSVRSRRTTMTRTVHGCCWW